MATTRTTNLDGINVAATLARRFYTIEIYAVSASPAARPEVVVEFEVHHCTKTNKWSVVKQTAGKRAPLAVAGIVERALAAA